MCATKHGCGVQSEGNSLPSLRDPRLFKSLLISRPCANRRGPKSARSHFVLIWVDCRSAEIKAVPGRKSHFGPNPLRFQGMLKPHISFWLTLKGAGIFFATLNKDRGFCPLSVIWEARSERWSLQPVGMWGTIPASKKHSAIWMADNCFSDRR